MVVEFAEEAMGAAPHPAWIGPRPTRLNWAASMWAGIVSTLMLGVQPLLLGALAVRGGLTAGEIGRAATGEVLVMGLTCGLAGAFLPPARLRWVALASALMLAAIDVATQQATHLTVELLRTLAGVPSGLMLWIVIGMIARSPTPQLWGGVLITLQTLAQFLSTAAISGLVMPRLGVPGGYGAVAVLTATVALSAFALPARYVPLGAEATGGGPPAHGWVALVAFLLMTAGGSGVFVYLHPLGIGAHMTEGVIGLAASLYLGAQALGGAAAAGLAGRVRPLAVFLVNGAVILVALALVARGPSTPVFVAAWTVMGFTGLMLAPMQIPFSLEIDPSRRTALQIGGAQLLGAAGGALAGSFVVRGSDATPVLAFGGGCLILSLVMLLGLQLAHRRRLAAAPA